MSSQLGRRLRGIVGTMITWCAAGVAAGALVGVGISLAVLWPRGVELHLRDLALGIGIAGGICGAVSGLAFALLLTLSERRRSFDELRGWRIGAWGAVAAGAVGLLVSRSPLFALTCSTMGFTAAAGSLAVARRALAPGDEPGHLLPPA